MARKDKPYLPLYVQDVLTDERLIECSAEAHGVYFRLMCILHKQDVYGLLCLKQKHKQKPSKLENFACMLVKQMPFEQIQIQKCLQELEEEGVISIQDDCLFQKRMIADGELSSIRSDIGKTGGSSVTKQYGKKGFLYWIGDSDNKNKIGISVNVLNRLYRLRSDLNLKKLSIIEKIAVDDMGKSEDFAHAYFEKERDGEWVFMPHNEMAKRFALLKAKLQAKTQANSDIDIENSISLTNGNGAWSSEKKIFLNADQWQYKQVSEYRISKDALLGYINVFLNRIELAEDYKSEKDLKRHCANWLRKNISADKTKALEEKRILPENYWTD
jgi:hypothetical protein